MGPPVEAPFSPGSFAGFLSEDVRVRDGRRLTVRPIQREDAGLLIEFHERLSPQSRYLRFFSPVPHLSPKMADYLEGVDFVDRFALVATADEDGVERIVAVARFDIAPDDVVAEVALVVRDDYQGVGLGIVQFGLPVDDPPSIVTVLALVARLQRQQGPGV